MFKSIYCLKFVFMFCLLMLIPSILFSIHTPHILNVVLVEFQDVHANRYYDSTSGDWTRYTDQYAKQDIMNHLIQIGYPDDIDNFGSVRDFFLEMSVGEYDIHTVNFFNEIDSVSGEPIWLQLPNDKEYYLKYGSKGRKAGYSKTRANMENLAKSELGLTYADFNQPDEMTVFLYAGCAKSRGLCAHALLHGRKFMVGLRADYLKDDHGENRDCKLHPSRTWCHEIGHVMGFRDLISSYSGEAGAYCVMAGFFTSLNPFYLLALGWADYSEITRDIKGCKLHYTTTLGSKRHYYVKEIGNFVYLFENKQFGYKYDGEGDDHTKLFLPHTCKYFDPPYYHENKRGIGGLIIWRIPGALTHHSFTSSGVHILMADREYRNSGEYVADVARSIQSQANDIFRPQDHYFSTGPDSIDRHVDYTSISDYSRPDRPFTFKEVNGGKATHFAIKNFNTNGDTMTVDFLNNYWEGDIDRTMIWTKEDGPYTLGSDINVTAGNTLWIEPDAIVDSTSYGNYHMTGDIRYDVLSGDIHENTILTGDWVLLPSILQPGYVLTFAGNSRIDLRGDLVVFGTLVISDDAVVLLNGYKMEIIGDGVIDRSQTIQGQ